MNPYNVEFIDSFNFKPFSTVMNFITHFDKFNMSAVIQFFAINLLLYQPIAIFLGLYNCDKKIKYIILMFLPIILEFAQVVLKIGVFDIDAILLNIVSSLLVTNIVSNIRYKKTSKKIS